MGFWHFFSWQFRDLHNVTDLWMVVWINTWACLYRLIDFGFFRPHVFFSSYPSFLKSFLFYVTVLFTKQHRNKIEFLSSSNNVKLIYYISDIILLNYNINLVWNMIIQKCSFWQYKWKNLPLTHDVHHHLSYIVFVTIYLCNYFHRKNNNKLTMILISKLYYKVINFT